MTKVNTPDAVLDAILAKTPDSLIQERLRSLHALCEARHAAGEHDFTRATLGKLCAAQGIMRATSLQGPVYPPLVAAWSAFNEEVSLGDSSLMPSTHPVVVLKALLGKDIRGDRKVTLRRVHEACKQHHASGSRDFSFSTMGKLFAEQGIIGRGSLKSPDFIDLRTVISAWDDFARPWLPVVEVEAKTPRQKQHDTELTWVQRDHPEFEAWRSLAVEWLAGEKLGLSRKLAALARFFEDYLVKAQLPANPAELLARGGQFPAFRETASPTSSAGIDYNNAIHVFLNWVLVRDFSILTDDGVRLPSPAFRNPVPLLSKDGLGVPDESVRSPLPYGYIDELRRILAPGPSFNDWVFAQNALGAAMGEVGAPGRDWFDVTEDMVDRNDPDCVLRVRLKDKRNVLQMWSPVRWVAVLVKLLLPLRSTQVRLLDSGEADTWRLDRGIWAENSHPLAAGPTARLSQQGVLRRVADPLGGSAVATLLYVNTNKTADKGKEGLGKGYVMPWFVPPSQTEDVFYWLERLRNWQERYNPVARKTSWTELDGRHISLKSAPQLAGYSDSCFLFRLAESNDGEVHLPVSDGVVSLAWANLLQEMSSRLAARGDTHADGSPIKLATVDAAGRYHTAFPLHSLRVSLITALALDGKVPFPILQKLVGHSRLLMTLYYFKPGNAHINTVLQEAAVRLALEKGKEKSISEFLLNTDHDRLVESAICNSARSLAAAIPEHPGTRNAAGWMLMHHGLCLVGGNTSEMEDNRKIGGCHNGGPSIGNEADLLFGPVPGGSRNCVRCRWFVTEPHHLPALVAQFNTLAYHFDEARNKSLESEERLQNLKRQKAGQEAQGLKFEKPDDVPKAERLWESNLKRFSDLAEDLVACWRLIERCREALAGPNGGMQLLVQGSLSGVQAIFEETESELLQLSGVCESLELYPDLQADKAILRRSQLLDSALYNEGLRPVFMQLSEGEQLLAGNSFMRHLALQVNPDDPALAQRQVIALMDAGKHLGEHLGIELSEGFMAELPGRAKRSKSISIKRIDNESTV
jgi:hypothetical protein